MPPCPGAESAPKAHRACPAGFRRRIDAAIVAACVALAGLAALATPAPSRAQGDPDWNSTRGIPVCVAQGPQYDLTAASDGSGGAIVAWEDGRGAHADIYVQRINAAGAVAANWPPDGVAASMAAGGQHLPRLAADGSGGAYIVWEDLRGGRPTVFLQHITAQGRIEKGWPADGMAVCTAEFEQRNPAIIPDADGGVYVAWQDGRNGTSTIYLQKVASDATIGLGWPTNGLAVTNWLSEQALPQLMPDGAGGAVLLWEDARTGNLSVVAQRITPRGTRAAGWPFNGLVLSSSLGRQDLVRGIPDGSGGVIAVWRDGRRGTPDLYALRVRGSGVVSPDWPGGGLTLTLSNGHKTNPRIVPDGAGGAVVTWEDYRDGARSVVYAQRIDGAGQRPAGWPGDGLRVAESAVFQVSSALISDGSGGAFSIWQDFKGGVSHVFGQHLDRDGDRGTAWPAEGLQLTSDPSGQAAPQAVADAAGGAVVFWENGLSQPDVYAAHVGPRGLVPSGVALVDARFEGDGIRVEWRTAPGASFTVTVQRDRDDNGWSTVHPTLPDPSGAIVFIDRDIEGGSRYGYRLALPGDDGVTYVGEVWVETLVAPPLALAGFVPNPARRDLIVSFSLPTAQRASLELIDVTGRRVLERDVGTLGPGRHVLNLAENGRVPPGFYLLRLTHADRTLTARGSVIR